MTGTDLCVNKPHQSRSYFNHLVFNIESEFIFKPFSRVSERSYETEAHRTLINLQLLAPIRTCLNLLPEALTQEIKRLKNK